MTTEEKARAYDEAIGKAQDVFHTSEIIKITDLFPQLAESEDERIRKAIRVILIATEDEQKDFYSTHGLTRKDCTDWLEKQKEQKVSVDDFKAKDWYVSKVDGKIHNIYYSVDKVKPKFKVGDKIIEKDFDECGRGTIIDIKDGKYIFDDGGFICIEEQGLWKLVEQKPAEWSEDIILKAVKEIGLTQYQINWFKSNVFPPKQEWSEEDKEMINTLVGYVKDPSCWNLKCPREKLVAFIESLPERFNLEPKQEWSEKEKKMLAVISYKISQHQGNDERSLFTPDEAEFIGGMEDKFKSLRPQSKKELSIEKAIQWLDDTFYFLDNSSGRGRDCEITTHDFDSLEEMYDSFRKAVTVDSEPHWEPSEEQMETLRMALHINPASGKLHELKENEVCILQGLLKQLENL